MNHKTTRQRQMESLAVRSRDMAAFLRQRSVPVNEEDIYAVVLPEYNVPMVRFIGEGRGPNVVEAREAWVWLAMKTTWYSYLEIAVRMESTTHSTAISQYKRACAKYAKRAKDTRGLRTNDVYDQMRNELIAGGPKP